MRKSIVDLENLWMILIPVLSLCFPACLMLSVLWMPILFVSIGVAVLLGIDIGLYLYCNLD